MLRPDVAERNRHRFKHGMSRGKARVYNTWAAMKQRCKNPNTVGYHRYGGRGITYDPRWEDFKAFLADMGEPPPGDFSLDRIDNDGNYTRANCRWADRLEQNRNKRGELHHGAKLSADDVRAIRASSRSTGGLAQQYGISKSVISGIRHHKAWRSIM